MPHLGLDIGGTTTKAAVLDRHGRLVAIGSSSPYTRPNRAALTDALREAFQETDTERSDIRTIGLCVPGVYDRQAGFITLSVNVPGLVGLRLDELVQEAIGGGSAPTVASDAYAGAFDLFASRRLGGRLLAITLGTGVGAALLDNGRCVYVDGESPGHPGQMDVSLDANPPLGPDGGAGSLEAYIGAPALRERYGEDFAADRLRMKDAPVRALVKAMRICHAIYRPDHIALLGGIGIRLSGMASELKEAVSSRLTSIAREGWGLEFGDCDHHAAQGASRMAMLAEVTAAE